MTSPEAAILLNYIRPDPRGAGQVVGRPIDTHGFRVLRAILLVGEPMVGNVGRPIHLGFGLSECDSPNGEFNGFPNPPWLMGTNWRLGIGWLEVPLGGLAGRRRYVRGEITVTGPGRITAGLVVELYRVETAADRTPAEELSEPQPGSWPGV